MSGVSIVAGVRYHDGRDRAQPRDDDAGIVEPPHMGVAGGEKAIRAWKAGIVLDRQQQLRHRLIKAAGKEMCETDDIGRCADTRAGAEAQCGIEMLDRGVRLARPYPEKPADVPATREV